MLTFENIIFLCWAIFLFYWIINLRNVKPTQEKKFVLFYFRWIVIVLTIIIVIISKKFGLKLNVFFNCGKIWFACHSYLFNSLFLSMLLQSVGTLFTIIGLTVALLARRKLAGNWSGTIDIKKGHELITTGVYSYIRHPIYAGVLLMGLGTIFVSPSFAIILIFLFVFIMFLLRIRIEERLMAKLFPKGYSSYKKQTKMLIPFIW